MQLIFKYDINKEYESFKKAFGSINHKEPSAVQVMFFDNFKKLTKKNVIEFAKTYIKDNSIEIQPTINNIKSNWNLINDEFIKRTASIFKKTLPIEKIIVYLTINDRCAYSFKENYFFVRFNHKSSNRIIMHELLHWYFWHSYGKQIHKKYGLKIYNDIKESLTVLLNTEFKDLMGDLFDRGYPQHQILRKKIVEYYQNTKDINKTIIYCVRSLTT